MKKLLLLFALCAAMTMSFVACESGDEGPATETPETPNNPGNSDENDDDNNNNNNSGGGDNGGNDGGVSELSPDEHKETLEQIAVEYVSSFKPEDTKDLVYTVQDLIEYFEDADFPDYFSEMMGHIARGAENMSAVEFAKFATRAIEGLSFDLNDKEQNPYAGHSYTYKNNEWIEETIDRESVQFVWDNTVALLKWDGGKYLKYEYKEDDTIIEAVIPATVNFTIKVAGQDHISADVTTKVTDRMTMAPHAVVKIFGGYEITVDTDANNKGLEAATLIKKQNKFLSSTATVVAIDNFTDVDNWFDTYYCEWCGENHTDIVPEDYFLENAKTGKAQINILDKLSILCDVNGQYMFEEISGLSENYDWYGSNGYIAEEHKKFCDEVCKIVNERAHIILKYSNSNEKVADIVMQVTSYRDHDYLEYDLEPILVFPDGSKYAFEDYFTEAAFGNLIDTLKALADEVEDMM